jgi:predicted O-methyltransferase YrrM
MTQQIDPTRMFELGEGFMASKTVLSAIELELFTVLGDDALTGPQIGEKLGLHQRAIPDFPDTLVALGMLARDDGPAPRYRNTAETAAFLDKSSPAYLGGVLEMCNARLYGFWGDLTEALQTGAPQNETKRTGQPMFTELYTDPSKLEQFMNAMTGASLGGFHALADKFDFAPYQTVCDLGGATGQLSLILAARHPHLRCTTLDLPPVEPLAQKAIDAAGLNDRVTTHTGDFLVDPLPQADVIVMSMILHDHNLDRKRHLIQAAYDALTPGGALISVEAFIDDARRTETFALLMSLNMLIEFGDGAGFTGSDYTGWCIEAGFNTVEMLPLLGWATAGVAYK